METRDEGEAERRPGDGGRGTRGTIVRVSEEKKRRRNRKLVNTAHYAPYQDHVVTSQDMARSKGEVLRVTI